MDQISGIAAILTYPLDVEIVEMEEREEKERIEREKQGLVEGKEAGEA